MKKRTRIIATNPDPGAKYPICSIIEFDRNAAGARRKFKGYLRYQYPGAVLTVDHFNEGERYEINR